MNRREEYWVLTEQLRREPPELESARGKQVTVRVGYPTVQEGSLQDVGIDRDALDSAPRR